MSELLGSWGDNELSPECLDGAQKCLRDTGVSIPSRYTSYLAPISSTLLWTCVKAMPPARDVASYLDSPFVVKLHNYHALSPSKELFTFEHPNHAQPIDNRRYASVSFTSSSDALLHGFCGTNIYILYPSTYSCTYCLHLAIVDLIYMTAYRYIFCTPTW